MEGFLMRYDMQAALALAVLFSLAACGGSGGGTVPIASSGVALTAATATPQGAATSAASGGATAAPRTAPTSAPTTVSTTKPATAPTIAPTAAPTGVPTSTATTTPQNSTISVSLGAFTGYFQWGNIQNITTQLFVSGYSSTAGETLSGSWTMGSPPTAFPGVQGTPFTYQQFTLTSGSIVTNTMNGITSQPHIDGDLIYAGYNAASPLPQFAAGKLVYCAVYAGQTLIGQGSAFPNVPTPGLFDVTCNPSPNGDSASDDWGTINTYFFLPSINAGTTYTMIYST